MCVLRGVLDAAVDEATFVARDIVQRGLAPTDCAVLARTGKLLESAAKALIEAGLDAYVARRKSDFESPVVRVVLNALRLANARHDRDILRRLCVAWGALSDTSLEVEGLAASATLLGGDFLRAWVDGATALASGRDAVLVAKLRSALVDRLEFPGVVEWFHSDGWKFWEDPLDDELREEMETWREIHGDISNEHDRDDLTLNVYLQQMDLAPKAPRPGPQAVRCMTVHGSKGLEFKHVYLIGMAQEVLPSFQSLKKGATSREVEEERRNCFVAITRVQESLTLTRARQYGGWAKLPSQFLAEMGLETE